MTGKEISSVLGQAGEFAHPISLLILQPTPFCNLNCDYCYLPNRNSTKRMSAAVLKQTLESVLASGLVKEQLSIVWHAGEPLALPISYYQEAFQVIESVLGSQVVVQHSIQSNGTLISDEWCNFIKQNNIRIGLSIDGPAFIHDTRRKNRRGTGTHGQVMKGVELLRRNQIDFHVIAVVTRQSLDFPEEIFDFFLENGISRVGLNIEEVEGVNQGSTLGGDSQDQKFRGFLEKMYRLQKNALGAVKIREFDRSFQAIASASKSAGEMNVFNDQAAPLSIVSVDCEGNFSTFSPELLGMKSQVYGDFSFGNVMKNSFSDLAGEGSFRRVHEDIRAGVKMCSETCEYYFLCGGGAPANKYYENGSFASTETMYCRYTIKAPLDIVLADLEEALKLNSEAQCSTI
jgi:uncharacterized protein